MSADLLAIAADLQRRGETFALATVVRCERPTSAKPGAKAIIRADGTVVGWVGGACAEPVVLREALAALADGQPRFIGLFGDGGRAPSRAEGMLEFAMTCHSGGTLEVYVEPYLPKPLLVLIGHGPVVETLERLGGAAGHDVVVVGGTPMPEALGGRALTPRASMVVATHGDFDEDALAWALASDAGYVSLVASRRRAEQVHARLAERGLPAERLGRLKAPAGLDIGAVTPEEIAVSILAEIIQHHRSVKPAAPAPAPPAAEARAEGLRAAAGLPLTGGLPLVAEARDPVCGMSVIVATSRHRSEAAGQTVYFCCAGCKATFARDPRRYLAGLER
jgi:xanthine dehydrogenase accessory factor